MKAEELIERQRRYSAEYKARRVRAQALAADVLAACLKHGARLHNDGAAGMWFEVDADEPGSEYEP